RGADHRGHLQFPGAASLCHGLCRGAACGADVLADLARRAAPDPLENAGRSLTGQARTIRLEDEMVTPTIAEAAREAVIADRSDVVVVGGGPAGISAAVSAARNGASVTLVERYPYLGGLASGGMVLVLDDMHNGTEVTVTGICMEMIERMRAWGLCVTPPEEDRRPGIRETEAMWRKWARWGLFDFHTHSMPHPICFA